MDRGLYSNGSAQDKPTDVCAPDLRCNTCYKRTEVDQIRRVFGCRHVQCVSCARKLLLKGGGCTICGSTGVRGAAVRGPLSVLDEVEDPLLRID